MPAELMQPCEDPGVPEITKSKEVVLTLAKTRRYAACANAKHRDSVRFYETVKAGAK